MNRSDCKALRSAALELLAWAKALHAGHTVPGTERWGENKAQREAYTKHLCLAGRLQLIAAMEQAKLPKKPKKASPR
jgi:hypothetical protein